MKLLITGSPTAASSGYLTVEDEGTPLAQRTTINFVGAGVTSTDSAGKTVVTIPGGGGSSGSTTLTFGSRETTTSVFVADTTIGATQKIIVTIPVQASASNTLDDHWVENLTVNAGNVSAGVGFYIYAKCTLGFAHGIFNINWSYT